MKKRIVQNIIDRLYVNVDGFRISQEAKEKLFYSYIGYEYGEVTFESFYTMVLATHPGKGEIFYDLGSGVGKKVISAALCFEFSKSAGIEVLQDLHIVSKHALERLKNTLPYLTLKKTIIDFVHADYNECDFSDGDVVYIYLYPSALEIELGGTLGRRLDQLKIGSRLITTSMPFLCSHFIISQVGKYQYTDGHGIFFIHKKIQ